MYIRCRKKTLNVEGLTRQIQAIADNAEYQSAINKYICPALWSQEKQAIKSERQNAHLRCDCREGRETIYTRLMSQVTARQRAKAGRVSENQFERTGRDERCQQAEADSRSTRTTGRKSELEAYTKAWQTRSRRPNMYHGALQTNAIDVLARRRWYNKKLSNGKYKSLEIRHRQRKTEVAPGHAVTVEPGPAQKHETEIAANCRRVLSVGSWPTCSY